MEPAQKKRRLGRFASRVKLTRKLFGVTPRFLNKSKPITKATLSKAIQQVGSGKANYFRRTAAGSFNNPAPNVPGVQLLCLTDPQTWSQEFSFGAGTDCAEQPRVTIKESRFQCCIRVPVIDSVACRVHAFIVSLKPVGLANLQGAYLTAGDLVDHTNFCVGNQGTIELNPDYFHTHRSWSKTLGGLCYPPGAVNSTSSNIADNHWAFKWSTKKPWIVKNNVTLWKQTTEVELPGYQRVYFIAFQVSTTNTASTGYAVITDVLHKVIW